jgi:hypothetical protein
MDGVTLIVVNEREGLENNDDTIEHVVVDFDVMSNLSVPCHESSISLLSFMANRSHRPSIVSKTR